MWRGQILFGTSCRQQLVYLDRRQTIFLFAVDEIELRRCQVRGHAEEPTPTTETLEQLSQTPMRRKSFPDPGRHIRGLMNQAKLSEQPQGPWVARC